MNINEQLETMNKAVTQVLPQHFDLYYGGQWHKPAGGYAPTLNPSNQQVLAQLSSRLIASQFGQGAIKAGSYNVGNYQIQITPGAAGIAVQVTDTSTGNQTTITIPNGL